VAQHQKRCYKPNSDAIKVGGEVSAVSNVQLILLMDIVILVMVTVFGGVK
jgi:hypothetical protein